MNIGFVGLGKLGLPCALAIESRGHKVVGYDPSEQVKDIIDTKKLQYEEIWAQEHLDKSKIEIKSLMDVVGESEIIFIPIQTPHGEKFEGTTRIPDEREDFDYTFLKQGIKDLSEEIYYQQSKKVVIIISTVLPGTIRREIKPIIDTNPYFKLCYNPFFIAMGTTMRDFLDPEMVLFGVDDSWAAKKAKKFYRTLHHSPFYETTIETAELTKVTYNTFISTKISFVNTVMEMCDKLPNTNVDDVMNALKMCDDRIISDKYLSGGMGDGGGCHPRDNIALSWLSKKLDLSHDWFDNIMMQRENQTDWLADLIEEHSNGLPINILGKSFKPETNITTGSPSILLKNILEERGHPVFIWDPYIDEPWEEIKKMYDDSETESQLYFIGTKHPDFTSFPYEKGSVIIDPWRYIPKQDSCEVIHIGDSIDS
jgi:UDPglucose 6-dehydrogenase|tara:strand:- start:1298 stop:2572 length:1275 start_codon:yes stop_codon:yes gene_type:complete